MSVCTECCISIETGPNPRCMECTWHNQPIRISRSDAKKRYGLTSGELNKIVKKDNEYINFMIRDVNNLAIEISRDNPNDPRIPKFKAQNIKYQKLYNQLCEWHEKLKRVIDEVNVLLLKSEIEYNVYEDWSLLTDIINKCTDPCQTISTISQWTENKIVKEIRFQKKFAEGNILGNKLMKKFGETLEVSHIFVINYADGKLTEEELTRAVEEDCQALQKNRQDIINKFDLEIIHVPTLSKNRLRKSLIKGLNKDRYMDRSYDKIKRKADDIYIKNKRKIEKDRRNYIEEYVKTLLATYKLKIDSIIANLIEDYIYEQDQQNVLNELEWYFQEKRKLLDSFPKKSAIYKELCDYTGTCRIPAKLYIERYQEKLTELKNNTPI